MLLHFQADWCNELEHMHKLISALWSVNILCSKLETLGIQPGHRLSTELAVPFHSVSFFTTPAALLSFDAATF